MFTTKSSIRKVNHDLACEVRNSDLLELILEHRSLNKQRCLIEILLFLILGSELPQTDRRKPHKTIRLVGMIAVKQRSFNTYICISLNW